MSKVSPQALQGGEGADIPYTTFRQGDWTDTRVGNGTPEAFSTVRMVYYVQGIMKYLHSIPTGSVPCRSLNISRVLGENRENT